jgi:FemAB-related protein (PEP-CTERM system-associated)
VTDFECVDLDSTQWCDALSRFKGAGAGAGHLPKWGKIIKSAYGLKSRYLAATRKSQVCGLLPLVAVKSMFFSSALVSMPYLNDGGILSDDKETERFLWEQACNEMRSTRSSYLELRHSSERSIAADVRTDKISMVLDLSEGKDNVWMRKLHSNVRNKIRKSQKLGVEISKGADCLPVFYDMHIQNMQELGSPAHSYRFFKAAVNGFGPDLQVYAAHTKDKIPIGGKIVLYANDTVYFLWVSSPYAYRKYAAVSLLDWVAIEDAIDRCAKQCDFGRSTVGSTHYEFKKKWGAEIKQLYWHIYPEGNATGRVSNTIKAFSYVWKKLPTFLVRVLGPRIRGGIPQ